MRSGQRPWRVAPWAAVFFAVCCTGALPAPGQRFRPAGSPVRSRGQATDLVVVQFRQQVLPDAVRLTLSAADAVIAKKRKRHHNQFIVRAGSVATATSLERRLLSSPDVTWAHIDRLYRPVPRSLPNDAEFPAQWYLHNTGQCGATNRDLYAETAWDITRGTSAVVIAILDDGFDIAHEDLAANVFTNIGECGGGNETNGVDDDGNGYIDDWRGWNFVDGNNDASPGGTNDNHGTAVAGLAVAVADNAVGIAGLANRCRLLPIRIAGGPVTASDWAEAIEYAADNADVISISYDLPADGVIYDAMEYALTSGRGGKGAVLCTALGNDGVMRRYSSDAAAAPESISVSGSSPFDKRASFIGYGSDYGPALGLLCPAGGGGGAPDRSRLVTTDRTGADGYTAGDYVTRAGTSVSCPLAAAAAALVLSVHPDWNGLEAREVLEVTSDKIDGVANPYDSRGWSEQCGYGRINVSAAIAAGRPSADAYEPDDALPQAGRIRDGEIQYRSLGASDHDWASFTITTNTDILLTVLGTTNAFLRLYDANTNELAKDNNGCPSYSYLGTTLGTAGVFYARVENSNGVPVDRYGLHLALINMSDRYEPDDTSNSASALQPRAMQYRTLYPAGDVDWARFTLAADTDVALRTMGEWDGVLAVTLWSNETVIASNCNGGPVTTVRTQLAAGTYCVRVKDVADVPISSYQILLETEEQDAYEPDNTTNDAVSMVSGQRHDRTIYPADDVDYATFVLSNEANVMLITDTVNPLLASADGDTVLQLYQAGTGAPLATSDDDNNAKFSGIYATGLEPAVYYVRIVGFATNTVCPDYYISLDVFEKRTWIENYAVTSNSAGFCWPCDPAFTYDVQYSGNLAGTQVWTTATNIEGHAGELRWTDDGSATTSSPAQAKRRFYRIRVP